MKITPSRAIKIECGVCRRGQWSCQSKHCALRKAGPILRRIKQHCRDCTDRRVEECTGQIIGTQARAYHSLYGIPLIDGKAECPLFPFRYGKNPNLRRQLSETERKQLAERLKKARFQKKETFPEAERVEHRAEAEIGAN